MIYIWYIRHIDIEFVQLSLHIYNFGHVHWHRCCCFCWFCWLLAGATTKNNQILTLIGVASMLHLAVWFHLWDSFLECPTDCDRSSCDSFPLSAWKVLLVTWLESPSKSRPLYFRENVLPFASYSSRPRWRWGKDKDLTAWTNFLFEQGAKFVHVTFNKITFIVLFGDVSNWISGWLELKSWSFRTYRWNLPVGYKNICFTFPETGMLWPICSLTSSIVRFVVSEIRNMEIRSSQRWISRTKV